jgi:hypothetical protein
LDAGSGLLTGLEQFSVDYLPVGVEPSSSLQMPEVGFALAPTEVGVALLLPVGQLPANWQAHLNEKSFDLFDQIAIFVDGGFKLTRGLTDRCR